MKKIVVAVLVLIVAGGAVWYMKSGKTSTSVSVNSNTNYTMSQVALASGESKCWTVVSGKVYDLTAFSIQAEKQKYYLFVAKMVQRLLQLSMEVKENQPKSWLVWKLEF